MFYIIPSWYKQNTWNENEQCWYVRRSKSEFDDSVKQIQLFHRNKVWPYRLIVLGHVPNFRHFLHRQGMFRARYWSCFDAMCEITRRKVAIFSFQNIQWPEGTTFEYTPFAVVAFYCGEKFAQIEFGDDGNVIRIDMFAGGKLARSNIYDDRGFVASSVVYRDEQEIYQDYMMENGIWKLRRYSDDGHVEINPAFPNFMLIYQGQGYQLEYSKLRYDNIEEVINEVLSEYIALTDDDDVFCMAMHSQHLQILRKSLENKKTILSFFEERIQPEEPGVQEMIAAANWVVTDTQETAEMIKQMVPEKKKRIIDINPYDFRFTTNMSQKVTNQKILIPVDRLTNEIFERTIHAVTRYIMDNDKAEVHLFTRKSVYNRKEMLLSRTREVLRKYGYNEMMAVLEDKKNGAENAIDVDQNAVDVRFIVDQCVDELSVSRCMREQRVFLDMSQKPEPYVQITALSAGIPQIVLCKNQYIENHENAIVVGEPEQVEEPLHFYLDSLANWNDAMICSYDIGRKFSTEALLTRWRGVIDSIGRDKDAYSFK